MKKILAILLLCAVGAMATRTRPRNIVSTRAARRSVTTGAHLTYNGGPLLQNVEVTTIFWGPNWLTDMTKDQVNTFFQFVTASSAIDQLSEYSINGMTIGHGKLVGSIADSSVPPNTIDDTQLRSYLQGLISAGKVVTPNANSLYFIFTQSGVTVTLQGQSSCTSFCGYHSNISATGPFYAVVPFPNCIGCQLGTSIFNSITIISSHELSEAITDPIPGSGWYDNANGEIGDICEGNTKTISN